LKIAIKDSRSKLNPNIYLTKHFVLPSSRRGAQAPI